MDRAHKAAIIVQPFALLNTVNEEIERVTVRTENPVTLSVKAFLRLKVVGN